MLTTHTTVKTTHTRLRDFYPTPEVRRETEGYRAWLVQQSRREEKREDRVAYSRAATLVPGGKRIFAPWNEQQSAYKILTLPQSFFLVVLLLGALCIGFFLRLEALTIALGLVTTLYLVQLCLHACVVVRELARAETSGVDQRVLDTLRSAPWPTYTILCPLYKEAAVVPQFIKAMQALDYPTDKLQVLLLTEEEDSTTRAAIHKEGILPAHFQMMTVPRGEPRTKPRACNYGLLHTTGRYVVIFDAEDIPEPTQLKKAVLAFADGGPKLACVQAQLSFYNQTQNILTRLFSIEYLTWFALTLPALARAGFALPLGGTSNHFQASVLRALGGWDAYNVTEDCDLGMRVHQYGFQTGMLASTTFEEATSQLGNWLRQRSRWIKGFMQTYLVHTRHPLREITKKRGNTLLSLQAIIGGSFVVFINPLMWVLLIVYIAFRGQVEGVYQVLFPAPVLYGGALCLIAGNFFYVYIAMLICAKREQYSLVPWCFLLSLYWLLMSVAATKALFQLITKPHYWEKTRHGLHLGTGSQVDLVEVVRAATGHIADEETQLLPSTSGTLLPFSTTTERVRAIETLPVKAVSNTLVTTREKKRDYWFWATMVVASICSIVAMIHYYTAHEILLYGDAYSHMRIARSVFDSATPGLAQLGTVWLPLPHVLMWPFIWNDFLWHSGLAGGIPSMICFIISSVLIYLIIKRCTQNGSLSFAGTLLFILNPNALYLQTTPLSELTCIATFLAAGYAFLRWIDKENTFSLAITAFLAFLCTLSRYDGWAMFAALYILVIGVEIVRCCPWKRIIGHILIFGSLGGLGIVLWFLWNTLLFGDPRYFQQGPYSAQSQQQSFFKVGTLYSYHNIWVSLRDYTLTSVAVVGMIPLVLTVCIFLFYLIRSRRSLLELGILIFLAPFAFYVVSLYTGQGVIQLPAALPPGHHELFNVRYGIQMLAPSTILVAIGISWFPPKRWFIGHIALVILAIFQMVTITSNGIITLQEGVNNICGNPLQQTNSYLVEHYNGGYILQDVFTSTGFEVSSADIDFHNVIYQGSGQLWKRALIHPASIVEWVSFDPHGPLDQVGRSPGVHSSTFLKDFTLVLRQPNGRVLYHRKGLPSLPNRPLPVDIEAPYQLCTH